MDPQIDSFWYFQRMSMYVHGIYEQKFISYNSCTNCNASVNQSLPWHVQSANENWFSPHVISWQHLRLLKIARIRAKIDERMPDWHLCSSVQGSILEAVAIKKRQTFLGYKAEEENWQKMKQLLTVLTILDESPLLQVTIRLFNTFSDNLHGALFSTVLWSDILYF